MKTAPALITKAQGATSEQAGQSHSIQHDAAASAIAPIQPGDTVTCSDFDFAKDTLAFIAPGARLDVGGILGQPGFEIIGPLPRRLRHGLKRTVYWCHPLRLRSRLESEGPKVWRTSFEYGAPTFNLPSWGVVFDLLCELCAGAGSRMTTTKTNTARGTYAE